MTTKELDKIEARAGAAAPGPWITDIIGDGASVMVMHPIGHSGDSGSVIGDRIVCKGLAHEVSNADFIAHSREDIPSLVAEVRRLRAGVRVAVFHLETMDDRSGSVA